MVSRSAKYALYAMVCLAKRQQQGIYTGITSQEIAEETDISQGYLVKVLQRLARDRLVTSRRGPTGGFTLGRSPETINLLQIIVAVDPLESTDMGQQACLYQQQLGRFLARARDQYTRSLENTSLASILEIDQSHEEDELSKSA